MGRDDRRTGSARHRTLQTGTESASHTIERIHQEDLAQALGRRQTYQADGGPSTYDLFRVPGVDRERMFDHIMFAWLVGNCDAHAKNYPILEPGTGRARLAPIYDMVSTECYDVEDKLATSIGREVDLNRVNRKAIEALGKRIGFKSGDAIERLHDLGERVVNAVNEAKDKGLEHGPVAGAKWKTRVANACKWRSR